MKIHTKYHGEIEVAQEDFWHFTNGMPGFPNEKDFTMLSLPNNQIFNILQAVQTPELAYVITNPFLFFQDYEFKIDDSTIELIDLEAEKDLLVFVILNVKEPFEETTANLLAPIIFNVKNHKVKQIILHDTEYKIKHSLLGQTIKAKG